MNYRKRILWMLGFCLIILIFIPFETVTIPEWRIRIVNDSGNPIPGVVLRQHWNNYSFDFSAVDVKEEDKISDSSGYVTFPARTDRASVFFRIIAYLLDVVKIGIVHSSTGIHATVLSPDYSDSSVSYDGSGPLPDTLVIHE